MDNKGNPKVKPYDDKIVSATRDVLEQLAQEGECLDFEAELSLLDQVHSEHETSNLELYKRNEYAQKNNMDMIVMGNSIRNLLFRHLIGDTVLNAIQQSDRPLFLAQ